DRLCLCDRLGGEVRALCPARHRPRPRSRGAADRASRAHVPVHRVQRHPRRGRAGPAHRGGRPHPRGHRNPRRALRGQGALGAQRPGRGDRRDDRSGRRPRDRLVDPLLRRRLVDPRADRPRGAVRDAPDQGRGDLRVGKLRRGRHGRRLPDGALALGDPGAALRPGGRRSGISRLRRRHLLPGPGARPQGLSYGDGGRPSSQQRLAEPLPRGLAASAGRLSAQVGAPRDDRSAVASVPAVPEVEAGTRARGPIEGM
ncbi:MAG: hypothetical protein AVDCRST_MAG17-1043, partial [uncultured Solirubrobacterales bacterium]